MKICKTLQTQSKYFKRQRAKQTSKTQTEGPVNYSIINYCAKDVQN